MKASYSRRKSAVSLFAASVSAEEFPYGEARFATVSDIKKMGLLDEENASGIIIGTPLQILNVGNASASNPVLNFIGGLPNKAVNFAKGHIPFVKK